MCGICGSWGADHPEAVQQMMRLLRHRGPDAQGECGGSFGRLGHDRLSIVDVAGGDQPIYSEDGSLAVIANGEIYNTLALRQKLEDRHLFRTRSDVESIVHLYEEVGVDTAAELDGMFAFAIADGDELYLARDPIGIKPLYFGRRDGELLFASELKGLVGLTDDVQEFPAGHWFHTAYGFNRYYEVPDLPPADLPAEEHARNLRETLERSVVKRLMSDVPLGSFLSGGVDSSAIAAIAARHIDGLNTFAVGVEGSSDLLAARRAAAHIGSRHHEYVVSEREIAELLPQIVYSLESFDQDLVRSAVPCYFTARMAAEFVKVVLTGEGADELFAGYGYYRAIDSDEELRSELRRSVAGLHNVNLQRVDRLTMVHSIEGRVPFLDVAMIEAAQRVPASLKRRDGIEKWILRRACEDLLPPEIAWRDKRQFDEGSGIAALLPRITERWVGPDQLESYRARYPGVVLRSSEECAYHKLLLDAYPEPEAILANVGRWDTSLIAAP